MYKKKINNFLFFIVFVYGVSGQTITLKGTVKDSLQNSLAYANIIAKPTNTSKNLKFAITDDTGCYKLSLSKNDSYTILISYLGYRSINFKVVALENLEKNIVLIEIPDQLEEVIVEMPVIVKDDTITFNTKKFVTGEERKLKNVLKKIPGVEVNRNGSVFVQGKKVTKMLVEGKMFFGGGSKLAVENIPANAINKIQVIDNYSEVSFLKNLTDGDELAMNILLEKDKKKFAFGDAEVGKGNQDYYRTHSNLFYYSPKTNVNFIGNVNNTGEKTFTFKDYISFQGGVSVFLKENGSIFNNSTSDFGQFMETRDFVNSSNKFGALNIAKVLNNKLDVSGYAIFSHSNNETSIESINQYTSFTEEKEQTSSTKNILGIVKFNIEYAPSSNEQWYFRTQFKRTDNSKYNNIISRIDNDDRTIFSKNDADVIYLNQNIEWHNKLSTNHAFSLATDITFDKNNPRTLWQTNQSILQGLIPVSVSGNYRLKQVKETKNKSINTIFKYYWVLNNNNHIYTTLGNKYIVDHFYTNDFQLLENDSVNNFSLAGFGNNIDYKLNDLFVGVHYKFKLGIFELKKGAFLHVYNWKINQQVKFSKQKIVLLPSLSAKIKFSDSKKINFIYNLNSSFSNSSKLSNRFYLRSYNSVYKGNEGLENELFHRARIYYSRFSLYRGLMLFGSVNYTKKVEGIQNAVQFENENYYLSPVMVNNPEERWSGNLSVYKNIKKVKYGLSTTVSTSKYLQNINSSFVTNKNNSIKYTLSAKTLFDRFPTVEVGFKQSLGNYTSSNQISKFSTNEPFVKVDYDFLDGFIFSFDYENYRYVNKTLKQKSKYQLANTSLYYKNEDSAWSFKIEAQNLFNVKFKQQNSFSSYIISDSKTYIMPRIVMFTLGYNL